MRNNNFEQLILKFLEGPGQNDIANLEEFNIECYEPGKTAYYDYPSEKGNSKAASIMTKTGNLRQLRDLIEELISNGEAKESDYTCVNMREFANSRIDSETDWVLTVHIKTESGLNILKKSLKEAIEYHKETMTKRNIEMEKILNTLYKKEYDFTEPYEGKKGKYPAEIFCHSGSVDEIINLFKEMKLEQDIISDDCNMKKGLVQVIIKTEAATKEFKKNVCNQITQKSEELKKAMFFYKPSTKAVFEFSPEEIADIFQFDTQSITSLKIGLGESIEIQTKDLDAAYALYEKICSKLEAVNNRTYGGLIRVGGIVRKEPLVELSFDALVDFKILISNYKAINFAPTKS